MARQSHMSLSKAIILLHPTSSLSNGERLELAQGDQAPLISELGHPVSSELSNGAAVSLCLY